MFILNVPVKDRYGDQDEGNSSGSSDSDSDESEVVKYSALSCLKPLCQHHTQVSMSNTLINDYIGAGPKVGQGFLQNALASEEERSKDLSERCKVLHRGQYVKYLHFMMFYSG